MKIVSLIFYILIVVAYDGKKEGKSVKILIDESNAPFARERESL